MFEKSLNNEFVDTTSAVADNVADFDDFYDDEIIDNAGFNNSSIPVNDFSLSLDDKIDDGLNVDFGSNVPKMDFNNIVDGIPTETTSDSAIDNPIIDDEPLKNFSLDNLEDEVVDTLPNDLSLDKDLSDDLILGEKPEEQVFNNLSSDDMDKMIEEDENKEALDDSYVLSNFDVLFDSLYNDVNGANNFISDLIEQKKNVNSNEASLKEDLDKFLKEKEEFAKYMKAQKLSIEEEKRQCAEFVKTQKERMQTEEEQFNRDMAAAKAERKLAEESLKIEEQKLQTEKEQFENYKKIEEQKLSSEKKKLQTEIEQFNQEKDIELERIKSDKKDLETQKEQFARTKELEEKKLELESKNLSQSCAKFKELVSQFNSGFQQLPEDK